MKSPTLPPVPRAKAQPRLFTKPVLVRFRPIMMTTIAALMGTLPIALGLGAGAIGNVPSV